MRQIRSNPPNIMMSFNPRICKRCDYKAKCSRSSSVSFNPRICKRCDRIERIKTLAISKVSIHASVKDATIFSVISLSLIISFNPRICKRCDYWFGLYPFSKGCFNPRICKRCDVLLFLVLLSVLAFQSTHL